MTADEIRLIELLASAAKSAMYRLARLAHDKKFTAQCFEQCEAIEYALHKVKEKAKEGEKGQHDETV